MNGKRIPLQHRHSLQELKSQRNRAKNAVEIMHLNVIILMQSEGISSFEASRRLKISPETARQIIIHYNENGLNGIKDQRKNNRRGDAFVNGKLLTEITGLLSQDCVYGGLWNGKKIQRWVNEKYNRHFVISTIYRWLYAMGYSLKVPRPRHEKSNKDEQEKFKKNNLSL